MAPFFSSWLGNGTSLLTFPVTLSRGPSDFVKFVSAAGFDEELERNAAARWGKSAAEGFAIGEKVSAFTQC
jgi:hypothetical protein